MAILIKNDVIWLQISEDDSSSVKIFYCQDYLSDVNPSSLFREVILSLQIVA